MITDKKTLRMYLDADQFALGAQKRWYNFLFRDPVWDYQRTLRLYEYHRNTGHTIRRKIYAYLLNRKAQRLGFSISANCFGPGLRINHSGLLIVNANARIGKWCDIHQGVTIAENGTFDGETYVSQTPVIGNYCFIASGAKVIGGCNIGDNVRIAANSVVRSDVPPHHTVYGNPSVTKESHRPIITTASKDTEEHFLSLYPQYRELLTTQPNY